VLNTCANPACCESFRYLRDGKLFRLQAEVKGSSSEINNPEYFWLCVRCAEIMSLRLAEDGQVIVVDASESGLAESAERDFIPLDRRGGLLLSSLQILRPSISGAVSVPRRRAAYAS
jgi:hypothetical protein